MKCHIKKTMLTKTLKRWSHYKNGSARWYGKILKDFWKCRTFLWYGCTAGHWTKFVCVPHDAGWLTSSYAFYQFLKNCRGDLSPPPSSYAPAIATLGFKLSSNCIMENWISYPLSSWFSGRQGTMFVGPENQDFWKQISLNCQKMNYMVLNSHWRFILWTYASAVIQRFYSSKTLRIIRNCKR